MFTVLATVTEKKDDERKEIIDHRYPFNFYSNERSFYFTRPHANRSPPLRRCKQGNLRIPPIPIPRRSLSISSSHTIKSDLKIRTGAESLSRSRQHDALDTLVNIEHGIAELKVVHHLNSEGVALFGSIKSHDNDGRGHGRRGRVVGDGDVLGGKVIVGFWDRDGKHDGGQVAREDESKKQHCVWNGGMAMG